MKDKTATYCIVRVAGGHVAVREPYSPPPGCETAESGLEEEARRRASLLNAAPRGEAEDTAGVAMRTCERAAEEAALEAKEWIERSVRRTGPAETERARFGPGGSVTVTVEWKPASGFDMTMGRWAILASGPSDPHSGGVPRSLESAMWVVRDGTAEVLAKMEEAMTWLRSRGVDLRGLADEATVTEVLES